MIHFLITGAQEFILDCKQGRDMNPQQPVLQFVDDKMIVALVGDQLNGGAPHEKKRMTATKLPGGGWGKYVSEGLEFPSSKM